MSPVGRSSGALPGVYRRLIIRDGVAGAVVADIEFTRGWANGETVGTTRMDYLGQNWALQANATIAAPVWAETADLGPSGEVVGYEADIQYIADGTLVPHRDSTALLSRRLAGGLGVTVIARVRDDGVWAEERIAETLGKTHFRPRPASGEGGPLVGSVSELTQYGPTYTDFQSKPLLLWKRGPTAPEV